METPRRGQLRFGDAGRAMRALLRDPDDTAQVFRIIDALSGPSGLRMFRRFADSAEGQRLLADRPALLELLADHPRLAKLPEGSLGREYLCFLQAEGITADGLKQASVEARETETEPIPAELEFLRNRMRDSHDLWHVITGYKGDLVGEAALLAFIFAQTRNTGVGFIAAVALVLGRERNIRSLIVRGFARGVRARWLVPTPWEELLGLPLQTVRDRLRVGPPPSYQAVRSVHYKQAMATA